MRNKGLDAWDWLFLLYIFKRADFWVAPTWVFVFLWISATVITIGGLAKDE